MECRVLEGRSYLGNDRDGALRRGDSLRPVDPPAIAAEAEPQSAPGIGILGAAPICSQDDGIDRELRNFPACESGWSHPGLGWFTHSHAAVGRIPERRFSGDCVKFV
jgi:hypothetical protein